MVNFVSHPRSIWDITLRAQGVIQNCISNWNISLRATGCDTELYINLRHQTVGHWVWYRIIYQSETSDCGPLGVIENYISIWDIRLWAAGCDTELNINLRHQTEGCRVWYEIVYQSETPDWEPQGVIQNWSNTWCCFYEINWTCDYLDFWLTKTVYSFCLIVNLIHVLCIFRSSPGYMNTRSGPKRSDKGFIYYRMCKKRNVHMISLEMQPL